jgi:hypothetical protein
MKHKGDNDRWPGLKPLSYPPESAPENWFGGEQIRRRY